MDQHHSDSSRCSWLIRSVCSGTVQLSLSAVHWALLQALMFHFHHLRNVDHHHKKLKSKWSQKGAFHNSKVWPAVQLDSVWVKALKFWTGTTTLIKQNKTCLFLCPYCYCFLSHVDTGIQSSGSTRCLQWTRLGTELCQVALHGTQLGDMPTKNSLQPGEVPTWVPFLEQTYAKFPLRRSSSGFEHVKCIF